MSETSIYPSLKRHPLDTWQRLHLWRFILYFFFLGGGVFFAVFSTKFSTTGYLYWSDENVSFQPSVMWIHVSFLKNTFIFFFLFLVSLKSLEFSSERNLEDTLYHFTLNSTRRSKQHNCQENQYMHLSSKKNLEMRQVRKVIW